MPALLGCGADEISDDLRALLSLGTKRGGIAVYDPTVTAEAGLRASKGATETLVRALLERKDVDIDEHEAKVRSERLRSRKERAKSEEAIFDDLAERSESAVARRMRRLCETGAWLTVLPDALNGTKLSADEFRDSLRIRAGMDPTSLPERCDGCAATFSVEHAFTCKKGGLVTQRHNNLGAEWAELCESALTKSKVSTEPKIFSGRANGSAGAGPSGRTQASELDADLRGDVGAHGFWRSGSTTIFDVRIVDTDAPSYNQRDPAKIIAGQEKAKKGKYLEACLERRRSFTPLVFSADGLMGTEAKAASRQLASLLSKKWSREYPECCGYVRSRLSLSLVRSVSLLLRGVRDPSSKCARPYWESGDGLPLHG